MSSQTQTPQHFNNLWYVAGMPGEDPHAGRRCIAHDYERDEEGRQVLNVEFVDERGEPTGEIIQLSPYMLFPVLSR